MATVLFGRDQQRWVNGDASVEIDARRVADLVEALYARYPELQGKLDDVAVAIDGDIHNDARYVPLAPDSEVQFVGQIAGGSDAAAAQAAPSANEALAFALAAARHGRGVAIATVIETWGSSPCPAGSQLAVDSAGDFAGSVSGGCVEAAVAETAQTVIATGEPQQLEFGVADEDAWAVGLACGGRVRIYLERVD